MELHGDRAGCDDLAIVTGIGTIDGKSYMFIGHQKDRNTKENIARNFAMPNPHGYVQESYDEWMTESFQRGKHFNYFIIILENSANKYMMIEPSA